MPPLCPFSIIASPFPLLQPSPVSHLTGYRGTRAQADLVLWSGQWKRDPETWALGRGEKVEEPAELERKIPVILSQAEEGRKLESMCCEQ